MRRLYDIDLLDEEQLQGQMAAWSIWILVLGILVGVIGPVVVPSEPLSPWWFVALVAVSVAVMPIHELVHAAAFKVLAGFGTPIEFGFSSWMLFTCAPGVMLARGKFCAVLLAPAIMVTVTLGVVLTMLGYPLLAWFCAVVHLAGCTGDFGYVRIIAGEPMANMIQDTRNGIALFHDE